MDDNKVVEFPLHKTSRDLNMLNNSASNGEVLMEYIIEGITDFEGDIMMLNDIFDDTREVTLEKVALRLKLMEEEFQETKLALKDAMTELRSLGYISTETKINILDGLVDQTVINIGTSDIFNFNFTGAWNEVMRSNLSKLQEDGTIKYRDDGKVMKGDKYSPPDLSDFVEN
jgi:predicted RNA-binding protein